MVPFFLAKHVGPGYFQNQVAGQTKTAVGDLVPCFAGRAGYSNARQSVENPRVVVTVPLNNYVITRADGAGTVDGAYNNSSRRCRHRHGAFKNSR